MLNNLIQAYSTFFKFVVSPNSKVLKVTLVRKQRFIEVCLYFSCLSIVVSTLTGVLQFFLAEVGFLNHFNGDENFEDLFKNPFETIVAMVIIAPLIEESLFRFGIGFYRNSFFFKWIYYLSSLIFGFVHFFYYDFTNSSYFLIPLITLPQICCGFIFGYVRVAYGIGYSILLHSIYNSFILIFIVINFLVTYFS
jgi:uncharacterized protein